MIQLAAAMRPLRSPLFVPGNNPRMLTKALGLTPDAFVPDMEDAVPWGEKEKGRATVASFLPRLIETGIPVIPRVNASGSGLMDQDLESAVVPGVFGITVGKTASADEVVSIGETIGRLEAERGMAPGGVALIPWIESALAVVNAYAICSASPRVAAVAFGAEDLANDMMIERTESGDEVAYARSAVCIAARAAGVPAIDTPFVRFRDEDGLRRDCASARRFGFKGKFAIHPAQVDAINDGFGPPPSEVTWAARIVEAFDEAEQAGTGAVSVDGSMVDAPVVKRARGILDLAARTRPH